MGQGRVGYPAAPRSAGYLNRPCAGAAGTPVRYRRGAQRGRSGNGTATGCQARRPEADRACRLRGPPGPSGPQLARHAALRGRREGRQARCRTKHAASRGASGPPRGPTGPSLLPVQSVGYRRTGAALDRHGRHSSSAPVGRARLIGRRRRRRVVAGRCSVRPVRVTHRGSRCASPEARSRLSTVVHGCRPEPQGQGRPQTKAPDGPRRARPQRRTVDRVEGGVGWLRVCGATGGPLQCDCVHGLSRGGRYALDNIAPARGSCNASKCDDEVTGRLQRKRFD